MPSRHFPVHMVPRRRHPWRRRATTVALAGFVALAVGSVAFAAWNATGAGSGGTKATSVNAGNAPTPTVTGRNVQVSWTASTLATGSPNASGYEVRRYNSADEAQTIGAGCSGTLAVLTCTEAAVPPGTWQYAVVPKYQSWTGAESAKTTAIVGAPTLTRTSAPSVNQASPGTFTGTTANFVDGRALTFRLDDPTTGTPLSGTPSATSTGGTDSISVALPTGLSAGTHTLYAITASNSESAGATFTVIDTTPPHAVSIAVANGGTAGTMDANDTITIVYSEALAVNTLCSAWSNDASNQSAQAVTISVNDGGGGTKDTFTVTTAAGGCATVARVGTFELNADNWLTSNASLNATMTWSVASKTLVITIGSQISGPAPAAPGNKSVTYLPNTAITDPSGNALLATPTPEYVSNPLF